MKHNYGKVLEKCLFGFALLTVLSTTHPISAYAGEKDVSVPFNSNVQNATITIKLESAGEYTGTLTSPSGDVYECALVDSTTLTCSIDKIVVGEWTLHIEDEYQDTIPKVMVSMSQKKINETDVVDSKNITVGKDIVGLKTYFVDNTVVIEWTDDTIGKVAVQVVDLDTNETLANSSTDTKRFTCELKDTTKKISVNIVPSSSSSVAGATTTYTYDVDNNPEATVSFTNEEIINSDTYSATVTSSKNYSALVYVDDSEVISNEPIPQGESTFNIPINEDGLHTITFYVVDENGNMRSTTKSITKDSVAPELELDSEYDNLETPESTYTISGKVSGQTTFTINDVDVTPASDGKFSYEASLHDGANTLILTARDNAGNETSYTVTLNMVELENSLSLKQILVYVVVAVVLIIVFVIPKNKGKGKKRSSKKKNSNSEDDMDLKLNSPADEDSLANGLKTPSNTKNVMKASRIALKMPNLSKRKAIESNEPENNNGALEIDNDALSDYSNAKENNRPSVKAKNDSLFKGISKRAEGLKKAKSADDEKGNSHKGIQLSFKGLGVYVAVLVAITVMLNFVISISSIKSGSMETTLMTGDIAVGNRLAYVVREPQRGDIIFFHFNNQVYCKRVIGVAGDEIAFSDGYVYINGNRIDESDYLGEDIETNCTDTFIVPDNCVFVLGDNRENSYDSRFFDTPYISTDSIISKCMFDVNNLFR